MARYSERPSPMVTASLSFGQRIRDLAQIAAQEKILLHELFKDSPRP